MNFLDCIFLSRKKKLVPDDKFDKHFKKARLDDIEARRAIFVNQSEKGEERRTDRLNIQPSLY